MKHRMPWQLDKELKSIVLDNTATMKTLWGKLKRVLDENESLFKNEDAMTIYSSRLEQLERTKRCYTFLKSGFFKREEFLGFYLITEIKSFNALVGDTFNMKLKDETILKITIQDYKDLKFLFNI